MKLKVEVTAKRTAQGVEATACVRQRGKRTRGVLLCTAMRAPDATTAIGAALSQLARQMELHHRKHRGSAIVMPDGSLVTLNGH